MPERVEMRCPRDYRRLFGVVINPDPNGKSSNEFACRDCRSTYLKEGKAVVVVLHTYGPDGSLHNTEVVRG